MPALTPVIDVDPDKCVNCHACIAACPVKFAIDGSGDTVEINHNLCIGCGNCIEACTHEARAPRDDIAAFMGDLAAGRRMVAIAAPAVASSFPDRHLHLNGYLKSLGVEAVFDVSFGAELTVRSYLEYIQAASPATVIAQPCPAIVSYIEIYQPELLRYLAPAHSPMLHTIQLIRAFFPEYADHRVAIVSPCIAKRREFDETGLGDYNVTMRSIDAHLSARGLDLSGFPEEPFQTPLPERAVLFSTPGGLKATVLREKPELEDGIRKIEGPQIIYDYLKNLPAMITKGYQPALIDCLNCDLGCNGGPGTLNQGKSPDEVEHFVRRRKEAMQQAHGKRNRSRAHLRKKVDRIVSKYWKPDLYDRSYVNRSDDYRIRTPNNKELESVYRSMHKYETRDFYNCTACGYNSCETMAIAIHNGLNKAENCHYYKRRTIELEHEAYARATSRLHQAIATSRSLMSQIAEAIEAANTKSQSQYAAVEESSAAIEEMMSSIVNASRVTTERKQTVDTLLTSAQGGHEEIESTIGVMETIGRSVQAMEETIDVINGVASNTNLLAMNAAIEAAHAGESGKGFAVVAQEIRKLAERTAENARTISETLSNVIRRITDASATSRETGKTVDGIVTDISTVAESLALLTNSMEEMSAGSGQINAALASLKDVSFEVKDSYNSVSEAVDSMRSVLDTIAENSQETLIALGLSVPEREPENELASAD